MEFINGKCPKCNGQLQVPTAHDTIICMYCGEKITTKDAIRYAEKQSDPVAFQEALNRLDAGILDMLFEMEKPMASFNRKNYADNFSAYCRKYQSVPDDLEAAYNMEKDAPALLKAVSDRFAGSVKKRLDDIPKKRLKEERLLDYNMTMVVFFFPALLEQHSVSGKELSEAIAISWKEHFPQTNIEPAAYERINSGFKRRFCYITTAVCESLNKPDDCYELNVLRNYRDGYLMQLKDGEELVSKYYDIAPTIVKHINKKKDKKEIYYNVWKEYLSPCIRLIEADRNEECMQVYRSMVSNLHKKYFS